jgi:hypothetical protein
MRRPPRIRLSRGPVIALCAAIAVGCAVASVAHVSLLPPSLEQRDLTVAAATARIAVDLPKGLVDDPLATEAEYQNVQRRAILIANLMTGDRALEQIARRAGVPAGEIAAITRVMIDVQPAMLEPDSERRAAQLADSQRPYQLEVRPDPFRPKLSVYAQAPSIVEAEKLANAALPGVQAYLDGMVREQGADPAKQVRLEQLGTAHGTVLNGGTAMMIAGLTFLLAFVGLCLAALGVSRLRRAAAPGEVQEAPEASASSEPVALPSWVTPLPRARAATARGMPEAAAAVARPALVASGGRALVPPGLFRPNPAIALPGRLAPVTALRRDAVSRAASKAGDWPHTTRVLPWLIAAFLVVVWLVPFNEIQLAVSLPIDLKFDRLVLPVLVAVWVLVVAAGGPDRPIVRATWIHVAVGAVVAMACLSLVLASHSLAETLEFDTAVKKLTLLGSYVMLFVIVASVVRRSEIRAFMTFTVILASICALGTIVEYRFSFNAFFWASDAILPGTFTIAQVTPDGIDEIGRRLVRGPGQVSLETVAMMCMALPIALARLIGSDTARQRLIYAAVTALLMAAMVSTFRKTALIAPVSVCLTFAFFRRSELLKLAPLGIVLVLLIQVLSPGALTGVTSQLDRSRLGVTTVSDRTADYDAVRPDLWTHLAFGRGYGSYEHTSYRILDMELLRQIVEVGVLGLIVYVLLAVAVIAVALRPIRTRGQDAPVALAVAATAVCFLVVSTLFDVMSFPHVPYIFLFMAAMLAVITTTPEREPSWRP